MTDKNASRSDRVMAQAEFPPGIDAPSPPDRIAADTRPPADVVRDIQELADRVGGLDRLRELVGELARAAH